MCEGQWQSSQRICAHLLNCRLRRRSYKLLHTRINTACTCYSSRIHLQSPESLHVALVTALTYTTEESILIDLQSCKIPPPPPAIRSPRSKRSHLSTKGAYGFGYRLLCVARCCLSLRTGSVICVSMHKFGIHVCTLCVCACMHACMCVCVCVCVCVARACV